MRDISLCEILKSHGFTLQKEGLSFRAKSEAHNIVVTGSRWFDNKQQVGGGGAIDLQMHLTGADFPTACKALAEGMPYALASATNSSVLYESIRPEVKRQLFEELAARYAIRDDSNWGIARSYLTEVRGIPGELVDELHRTGLVYANNHRPNPSLVFSHRDIEGVVRGASLRDTRHDSKFRPTLGNKLSAWFSIGDLVTAQTVAVVESPIDALSYFSLRKDGHDYFAVVSCSGATVPQELLHHIYDRRQLLVVALDNDLAGERGWQKVWDETADWPGFKISPDCPRNKDWNEDLIQSFGKKISPSIKL